MEDMLVTANINQMAGWMMVAAGIGMGMLLTPVFLNDALAGGYAGVRRRLLRLSHIAFVMLGVLNILAAMSGAGGNLPLLAGGAGMAAGCFVAAWVRPAMVLLPLFALAVLWGVLKILFVVGG